MTCVVAIGNKTDMCFLKCYQRPSTRNVLFISVLVFLSTRQTNGHPAVRSTETAALSSAANGNDTSITKKNIDSEMHLNYVATTTASVPKVRMDFKNSDEEFAYDMAALNNPGTRMDFVKNRIRAVLIFADGLQTLLTFLFRRAFGIDKTTGARELFKNDKSVFGKYMYYFMQTYSYKLWDSYQLFFALIAVYAGFAALHQSKFQKINTNYDYYDYLSRSNDNSAASFVGTSWFENGLRAINFVIDAINKDPI